MLELEQQQKELNESLKQGKPPKYIHINGVKILTPKDIVRLDIYDGNYMIYGDSKVKDVSFNEEQLESFRESNTFLVVLRRTAKKGGPFAFPVTLKYLLQQRKWRLANLINVEKIAEAQNKSLPEEEKKPVRKVVDFIKTLIPIKEGLSDEEIYDEFQTSIDDKLVCMDIKRIIQLYYQQ